jgi:peptide/nickel transport system ATP-binding protein/oligopeptide transport system ATP-binding protein
MTALVSLEAVSVHFARRTVWFRRRPEVLRAVDGVSVQINEGETLALVGESGSGKTTLGHLVAGLREPTSGRVRFRGEVFDAERRRAAGHPIQIVFQDPFSSLDPRMPVSDIIVEPLRIKGTGTRSEQHKRAAGLVEQVGLPQDALNRYPHEFSGGQRQRIAIARAIAPEPELIVADEPLSALDVSFHSQILNLMRQIQEERRLSYLFISHDLGAVEFLADRVAVLYLGRIVELASRDDLFRRPAHPYTQALLAAVPRMGRGRRHRHTVKGEIPDPLSAPSGCVFHPRCPRAADICRTTEPAFEPVAGDAQRLAACHFKD